MPHVKRDTCPVCSTEDQLLYELKPTDASLGLACPQCIRRRARTVERTTPCDICGAPGAWRNPRTRRNEFFCPSHHAESGDGIIQAPFARSSTPLTKRARPKCEITGDQLGCRGEVKPRNVAGVNHLLCTKHAGKTSATWAVEDGEA